MDRLLTTVDGGCQFGESTTGTEAQQYPAVDRVSRKISISVSVNKPYFKCLQYFLLALQLNFHSPTHAAHCTADQSFMHFFFFLEFMKVKKIVMTAAKRDKRMPYFCMNSGIQTENDQAIRKTGKTSVCFS